MKQHQYTICTYGRYALKEEQREKRAESFFEEIMAENVLNFSRYINIQIYEAQKSLNRINTKQITP